MKMSSIFNHKKNTHLQKRGLHIETLEQRQLLSAVALGADVDPLDSETMLVAPNSILVNTSEDVVDDTDGFTSLREAVAQAEEGDIIQFEEYVHQVKITSDLDGKGLTVQDEGDVYLDVDGTQDSILLENFNFDGIMMDVWGEEIVTLKNSTFTGEVDSSCLVYNSGVLVMNNVTFDGVNMTADMTEYEGLSDNMLEDVAWNVGGDGEGLYTDGAMIYNDGGLGLFNVDFLDNSLTTITDRLDNFTQFSIVYNSQTASTIYDGGVIGENSLTAESNRGDLGAGIYGVQNEGDFRAANLLIYGNSAETSVTDERLVGVVEEKTEEFGFFAGDRKDVSLYNCTLLDAFGSYRADFEFVNTIYMSEGNLLERGFLVEGTNNYVIENAEQLASLFAFYNAETKTFTDRDYRIYANAPVVDAGSGPLQYFTGKDARRAGRVHGNAIDIGAIESQADKLLVENVVAAPAEGDLGLTTVTCTWDVVEGASSYKLRYVTNANGVALTDIPEEDWTTVTGEFVEDGEGKLVFTLGELAQKTWVGFEVMAVGDNLETIDSDWTELVSTVSKSQVPFPTPMDFVAGIKEPSVIQLSWALVPGATSYTLEYRVKPGADEEGGDWNPVNKSDMILDTATGVVDVKNLQYETLYEFRIKADERRDDGFLDSAWAYTEETTGVGLLPVDIALQSRTTDTLTIKWTDTENAPAKVGSYEVQYSLNNGESWLSLISTDKTATVNGLPNGQTVDFRVRAMGIPKVSDTSAWATFEATTQIKLDFGQTRLVADGTGTTTISATWSAVANATGYKVRYSNDGSTWSSANVTITDTTANITGLTPDTTYTVEVTALGDNDDYVDSMPITDDAKTWIQLTAPTLTLYERGTDYIMVKWLAVANANGYKVQYKTTQDGAWQDAEVDNLYGTFEEEVDIDPAQGVWFQAKTLGTAGVSVESEWSTPIFFSETLERLVVDRTSVTAKGTWCDKIEVKWDAVDDADGYSVEYKVADEWVDTNVTITGTTANISGLNSNTTYEIRVTALGDTSEGFVDSAPVPTSAKTWIKLAAPAITVTDFEDTTVTLTWDTIASSSGYTLEYWADGVTDVKTLTTTNTTTTLTGLTANTLYKFRVRANGIDQVSVTSDWSETSEAETKAVLATPLDVVVSVKGLNRIDLSWAKMPDADSYKVEWRVKGTDDWATRITNSERDQILDNIVITVFDDLESATTYEFRVTALPAVDADFVESLPSDKVEATTATRLATPELTISNITNTKMDVSWTSSVGADHYILSYKKAGGEWNTINSTDTSVQMEGLTPNTTYTYKVQAIKTAQEYCNSEVSDEATATTLKANLDAPVLTLSYENENIRTNWTDVTGATKYTIYYREGTEGEFTKGPEVNGDTLTSVPLASVTEGATYAFYIVASGGEDTIPASSNIAELTVPGAVLLEGIIVLTPTSEGTTTKPVGETWVDEWQDIYAEIWTEDTAQLVAGRSFVFTLEIDDIYTLESRMAADGIQFTELGNNQYRVTIGADFVPGSGDTFFGRIHLVPVDENGVTWEERVNEDAVEFNEVGIIDVYAVPGDMNDDGTINFDQNGADTINFDKEYLKTESYADFDGSHLVSNVDRKWMLENNDGKSFFGDTDVVYPEGFPYDKAPVAHLSPVAAAVAPVEPVAAFVAADIIDEPLAAEGAIPPADEAWPIPVVKDENALSGSGNVDQNASNISESDLLDTVFAEYAKKFRI